MSVIGIDLGTTNSAVAVTNDKGITSTIADTDGARFIPSVIYFQPEGDVVIGDRAKSNAVIEPERVASLFKRGMGEATFLANGTDFVVDGKIWRPEELSGLILKKMRAMAERELGEVTGAIVTVPAYFGELERAATKDAARIAGLPVLRILNEPTAAAIAHGIDSEAKGKNILVFDLGGGTFDVTVMSVSSDGEMKVLSTGGNQKLGGSDFDALIVARMEEVAQENGASLFTEPWCLQSARDMAEEMKKELSSLETSRRPLQTGGRPVPFSITRSEFEEMLEDIIEDVRDMTEITLSESGLSEEDIDTVLMVGGSSRIPAFSNLMENMFGKPPTFSRNLDEDVARGASILATRLSGDLDPRAELSSLAIPEDVASHGLGLTVLDGSDNLVNSVVVEPGQEIPAFGERTFYSASDGQLYVSTDINEGSEANLEYVRSIGKCNASFGRPVPLHYPIKISIAYTEEQIVQVKAYDGETQQLIGEVEIQHEGLLSAEEKDKAARSVNQMEVE